MKADGNDRRDGLIIMYERVPRPTRRERNSCSRTSHDYSFSASRETDAMPSGLYGHITSVLHYWRLQSVHVEWM